jgi:hypothetical protein
MTVAARGTTRLVGGPRKRRLRPGFVDPCARRGPLTAAGKARSSQNARRHGLSLPVLHEPAAMAEVEALAQKICRSCGGAQAERNAGPQSPGPQSAGAEADDASERLYLACRIAEAQIDLERVRRVRHDLIARAFANPRYRPAKGLHAWIRLLTKAGELLVQGIALPQDMRDAIAKRPQGAEKLALILADEAPRLAKLDRYERRALSRRKFAIRAFDAAEVERARRRAPILAERNTPKMTRPSKSLQGPRQSSPAQRGRGTARSAVEGAHQQVDDEQPRNHQAVRELRGALSIPDQADGVSARRTGQSTCPRSRAYIEAEGPLHRAARGPPPPLRGGGKRLSD